MSLIRASSQFSRLITKKLVTTRLPPSSSFLVSFSSSSSLSSSSSSSSSNANNKYHQLNDDIFQHNATNKSNYYNDDNNNNTSRTYSNSAKVTFQPMEDLYLQSKKGTSIGQQDLVGRTASINRVFGPGASAQALLTCGGEELAQHASFDPNYKTAKDWIRKRPVGPAVLSSTLISGLVGALIEASFPQTVPVNSSLNFIRPLIVGCEVCARIQIESVNETLRNNKNSNSKTATAISTEQKGYEILLSTQVIRVQDDIVIAEGYHTVWIPCYL